MFRQFLTRRTLLEAGERARLVHSMWLTHHLRGRSSTGGGEPGRPLAGIPEIPSRKVVDGGFAEIMATPLGKAWAEDWWNGAIEHLQQME
ncbi:MAG: hypothetical protein ACNA8P_02315 [Phycisphaerales bacterium]